MRKLLFIESRWNWSSEVDSKKWCKSPGSSYLFILKLLADHTSNTVSLRPFVWRAGGSTSSVATTGNLRRSYLPI